MLSTEQAQQTALSTTPLLGTATNPSQPPLPFPSPTMSAAPASGAAPTVKATSTDAATTPPKDQKPAAALEEDDEFEDFPVEGALRALPSLCGSHGPPPQFCVGWGKGMTNRS
jgi:hypothetical protein